MSNIVHIDVVSQGKRIDLTVDQERSYLAAQILVDDPNALYWFVTIDCVETTIMYSQEEKALFETEDDGYVEQGHLEISDLIAPIQNWRELTGRTIEVAYESDAVHPMLPDNAADFYFRSRHHVPNQNRLHFGERRGHLFQLEWRFNAEASADARELQIEARTEIALRRFEVHFDDRHALDASTAERLVMRFAFPNDVGEPEQVGSAWVLPVRVQPS